MRHCVAQYQKLIASFFLSVGMGVPNYACVLCGRSFTRRTSANRHDFTLHNNNGEHIVPVIQYLAGISSGRLPPPTDPSLYRLRGAISPLVIIVRNVFLTLDTLFQVHRQTHSWLELRTLGDSTNHRHI